MTTRKKRPGDRRWGRFRHSVVGPLMSSPPEEGEIGASIADLARKNWTHPISGKTRKFAPSTIARWYYAAKGVDDPVAELARQIRKDRGTHPSMTKDLGDALREQHRAHPSWSYKLHADNLLALARLESLGEAPSYSTIRRFMKDEGLLRRPKPKSKTRGAARAAARREAAEVRSYEASYVNELWHYDFHIGSRRVVVPRGGWESPELFGSLDDFSRVACHVQWYLDENTANLTHGLGQAFQKRGLPRAVLSDNGAAMTAAETVTALEDLGISIETTLSLSPYQNGKQEAFWNQIEGRLLPMLEGVEELSLEQLNEATQAWVELEYNRSVHSETGEAPIQRFLSGKNVGRASPSSARLRDLFTRRTTRMQRKSDGTVTLNGVRFEVPSSFRHVDRLHLRYAEWNLSRALLVDPQTEEVIARLLPLDKQANADGRRRKHQPIAAPRSSVGSLPTSSEVAPLMRVLLNEYRSTGLPPAYIPKDESSDEEGENR